MRGLVVYVTVSIRMSKMNMLLDSFGNGCFDEMII